MTHYLTVTLPQPKLLSLSLLYTHCGRSFFPRDWKVHNNLTVNLSVVMNLICKSDYGFELMTHYSTVKLSQPKLLSLSLLYTHSGRSFFPRDWEVHYYSNCTCPAASCLSSSFLVSGCKSGQNRMRNETKNLRTCISYVVYPLMQTRNLRFRSSHEIWILHVEKHYTSWFLTENFNSWNSGGH